MPDTVIRKGILILKRYTKKFVVEKRDIDFNGHVGNIRYLEWFLDAATAHSEALGLGFETLKKTGSTWVAREHNIVYKSSAFEGDELELTTWLESIRAVQGIRRYELRKSADDSLICEGKTTWVFVGLDTYRPKKIPRELMDKYGSGD